MSLIERLKSCNKELLSSLFSTLLLHLAYKYKLTSLHYVHILSVYLHHTYVRTYVRTYVPVVKWGWGRWDGVWGRQDGVWGSVDGVV